MPSVIRAKEAARDDELPVGRDAAQCRWNPTPTLHDGGGDLAPISSRMPLAGLPAIAMAQIGGRWMATDPMPILAGTQTIGHWRRPVDCRGVILQPSQTIRKALARHESTPVLLSRHTNT